MATILICIRSMKKACTFTTRAFFHPVIVRVFFLSPFYYTVRAWFSIYIRIERYDRNLIDQTIEIIMAAIIQSYYPSIFDRTISWSICQNTRRLLIVMNHMVIFVFQTKISWWFINIFQKWSDESFIFQRKKDRFTLIFARYLIFLTI